MPENRLTELPIQPTPSAKDRRHPYPANLRVPTVQQRPTLAGRLTSQLLVYASMGSGIFDMSGKGDKSAASRSSRSNAKSSPKASDSGNANANANAKGGLAGLVAKFKSMALVDKILTITVAGFLLLEALGHYSYWSQRAGNRDTQISAYQKKEGGEGSEKTPMPLWLSRTLVVVIGGAIFSAVFFGCRASCRAYRTYAAASAKTAHLRTRDGASIPGGGGPLGKLKRLWKNLALFDKLLVAIVVLFGLVDLLVKAKENDVHTKVAQLPRKVDHMLRGTPAPTAAPTVTPPPPPEDPAAVLKQMEAIYGTQPKDEVCSDDYMSKIKSTGMDGSGCRGSAAFQKCAHTRLTRTHTLPFLNSDFAKEIVDSHKKDVNGTVTFLGMVMGDAFHEDCGKIGEIFHEFATNGDAKAIPQGGAEGIFTRAKTLCNSNFYTAPEVKERYGIMEGIGDKSNPRANTAIDTTTSDVAKTLDDLVRDAGLQAEIKDVVSLGCHPKTIASGRATLARTRFFKIQYDWKGDWARYTLKDVVEELDGVGHTCYWPGEDKLWRMTGCFQDAYNFRTYSFFVCVHRILAPNLHAVMEGKFKSTIGV